MTYHVDIADAPARLLDLIRAAEQGEEVLITKNAQPFIQLVPISIPSQPQPQFGSARGRVHMRDDFDDPIDDFSEYMT